MFGSVKGRIAVIVLVVAAAIASLLTNGIKLGLDLQGGMHLALEVSDPEGTLTTEAKSDAIDQNLTIIRNRIDQFGVTEPLVQKVGSERIIVELPGIDDEERAKAIIEQSAFLEWTLVEPTRSFVSVLPRMDRAVAAGLTPEELEEIGADTTGQGQRQSVEDLLFGGRDTARDTAAADTAAADTAAAAAPQVSATPLSDLLLQSGRDGEFLVPEQEVERVKRYLAVPGVMDLLPRGTMLRWGAKPEGVGTQLYRSLYFLDANSFLTGANLEEATAGRDPQFNQTTVNFQLDRRGGREFERVTGQNIGNRIAIVLDTLVHSAPVVQSRIGASGRIDLGQAPMEEASDLALVLRAGALSQPLEIVEQRSVGPSLGRDSIDQGRIAGIIGIIAVLAIMIGYYRFTGFLAVVALTIYVTFVLGGLAGFRAALSAPGIAGLILSLGMAVDANVLIFERIREELDAGRSNRAAVDAGFQHAMSAIVDSNLTTLITALILYQVGTGPVRGFAVTLSIGIIASFFTAVFVTRTFFLLYLERKRAAEPISI